MYEMDDMLIIQILMKGEKGFHGFKHSHFPNYTLHLFNGHNKWDFLFCTNGWGIVKNSIPSFHVPNPKPYVHPHIAVHMTVKPNLHFYRIAFSYYL